MCAISRILCRADNLKSLKTLELIIRFPTSEHYPCRLFQHRIKSPWVTVPKAGSKMKVQNLERKSKSWKRTAHSDAPKFARQKPFRFDSRKASVLQLLCRRYQRASGLMRDKLRFTKMMTHDFHKPLHFESPAIQALWEACQAYLLELFGDWSLCALHAKRASITFSDIHLVRCLQWKVEACSTWQPFALKPMVSI